VQARGAELRALLGALTERHPTLLESSRGWGLLQGLVLREGTVTAPEFVKAAIAQGLLLVPAGPRVVRFVPPLVIESTHLHEMVKRLELALVSLTAPTASVPFG
jgi:acetylornithine aminotransferase